MVNILLSSDEWRMLQDYKQAGPHRLIRLNSEALILLHEGIGLPVVGRIVERSEETVKDWCKAWDCERLGSIRTDHAGNVNASKLTVDQREEVRRILQRPPSDYDLPVTFGRCQIWPHGYTRSSGSSMYRHRRTTSTCMMQDCRSIDPRPTTSVAWTRRLSRSGWRRL